mgnify:CR=1 FL=1
MKAAREAEAASWPAAPFVSTPYSRAERGGHLLTDRCGPVADLGDDGINGPGGAQGGCRDLLMGGHLRRPSGIAVHDRRGPLWRQRRHPGVLGGDDPVGGQQAPEEQVAVLGIDLDLSSTQQGPVFADFDKVVLTHCFLRLTIAGSRRNGAINTKDTRKQ